jgi:hypothetical protein
MERNDGIYRVAEAEKVIEEGATLTPTVTSDATTSELWKGAFTLECYTSTEMVANQCSHRGIPNIQSFHLTCGST